MLSNVVRYLGIYTWIVPYRDACDRSFHWGELFSCWRLSCPIFRHFECEWLDGWSSARCIESIGRDGDVKITRNYRWVVVSINFIFSLFFLYFFFIYYLFHLHLFFICSSSFIYFLILPVCRCMLPKEYN